MICFRVKIQFHRLIEVTFYVVQTTKTCNILYSNAKEQTFARGIFKRRYWCLWSFPISSALYAGHEFSIVSTFSNYCNKSLKFKKITNNNTYNLVKDFVLMTSFLCYPYTGCLADNNSMRYYNIWWKIAINFHRAPCKYKLFLLRYKKYNKRIFMKIHR